MIEQIGILIVYLYYGYSYTVESSDTTVTTWDGRRGVKK